MKVVDISKFEDSVVLHFDTEGNKINAYTLASSLVSLADAAKAANSALNFGYEIEIVVEAIGPGSFRTKIRAFYKKTRNLFSSQILVGVVIGIVANYIYERTLSLDPNIKVEINTDEVIIESGEERVIVPREVYDATRKVETNQKFKDSIGKTLKVIEQDESIKGIGFVSEMDSPEPEVKISREKIKELDYEPLVDSAERVMEEIVELQIFKAILEKSRRKWEFFWRGIKISAPISDDTFYSDFFAHDITIAPGDGLEVRLLIKQKRDDKTGIYSNDGYEIVEVFRHIPRLKQAVMPHENKGQQGGI